MPVTYPGTYGSGAAGVWAAIVTIAGVDQSARVVGDIRVDAEEDAARVADVTLRPAAATTFAVQDWLGKTITIDVADVSSGSPASVARLFTGLIDTPSLDLDQRTISLRCTDDLQGALDALDRGDIDTLIPGSRWSSVIFDPAAAGWTYAQDLLSTVPASLSLSPAGLARVTDWAPKSTPDLALTAAHVLDGSLSISLAGRHQLVNQVEATFEFRFPRVKAETYDLNYQYVDSSTFAAHLAAGNYWLQRSQVEQAIKAAGGTIESITYTDMPTTNVSWAGGIWTPNPAADVFLCQGFQAEISFDYAQQIEERHEIAVVAPNSVGAIGTRLDRLSGALEGQYLPIAAAEHSAVLYRNDVSGIPPLDTATPSAGFTTAADVTLTADSDRASADAAMETLIAIAKARIWGSHRGNRVAAAMPLNPAIDLDQTLSITVTGCTARGKICALSHRLSPATGEAVTEFSLAICSVAGTGTSHPDTPITAPAGTSPASTLLTGTPSADFKMGPSEDHSITVTFPGVESAERAKALVTLSASYDATLTEDPLTILL